MIEVCFFLFLTLLFYGAGCALLIVTRCEAHSFTVPSCVGVVVVTLTVTWFYKLGGNLTRFFWIVSVLIGAFLLWKLIASRRQLFGHISRARCEFFAIAAFAAAVVLPALLGGEQFVIFRGNHYDSFNYLEAAITYRNLSYAQISHLTAAEFVRHGLFKFGRDNLLYRPEITFLYGALSSFHPAAFLRLHYILLVYFQFLAFCVVRALATELLPSRRIIALLLATALVGGFWGQYILDIDAWSQISCMPLAVLSLLILIKLTQTSANPEKPNSAVKLLGIYGLVWLGLFYLYPEAACFLLPAHAICWVIAVCSFKLRVNWLAACLAALGVCALLLPVFDSNLIFLTKQYNGSLAGFNWWTYFDAFYFAHGDVNKGLFSTISDFIAGTLGIYFVIPDPTTNAAMAAVVRAVILFGTAVLLFRLTKEARDLRWPPWLLLAVFVVVMLLCTLGYCLLHQYWTAGKVFSFIAYLVLLLLVGSAFRARSSEIKWLNRTSVIVASLYLLLQLGFFVYRPIASRKSFGIHYDRPYPAIMDPKLKSTINFANRSFLRRLHPSDKVAVQIEDPWIQYFVRMLLSSHHIKFCLEPPAFDGTAMPQPVVPTAHCSGATVLVTVTKSTKGPFPAQLTLEGFTARPTAKISGLSGEWITSAGLTVEASRVDLRRFPTIRISGPAYYWLPKLPTVSVTIETERSSLAVPALFRRVDDGYEILVDTSSTDLPPSDPTRLSVTFDTFFVPKNLGMNEDTRELVVPAPNLVQLLPKQR